jgi:micrococcal nuclease
VSRAVLSALLIGALLGAGRREPPSRGLVRSVIDGDTIELASGELVRYLGIDAPEARRRVGERWVYEPQPFAEEATEANRLLVQGRRVRLEYDVQTRDRFGRWLAYVYVADGEGEIMVNALLLEQGFAQVLTIPPNVRHAERFIALARDARKSARGLWGSR